MVIQRTTQQAQLTRLILGFCLQSIPGAMLTPMLTLSLAAHDVDALLIGALASVGSFSYMLALPNVPLLMRRLGARGAFRLALLMGAVGIVGLTLTNIPLLWVIFFALMGFSAGVRFTLAESWVPALATPETLGRSVGLFQSGLGAALFIGAGSLLVLGIEGWIPRAVILATELLALGLLWTLDAPTASHVSQTAAGRPLQQQLLLMGPLVIGAALLGGLFESGLSVALSLYGLVVGIGSSLAAGLVTAIGLGSLAQFIFGALTDRFAWQRVVLGTTVLLAISALLLPLALWWPWVLLVLGVIWGSAGGGLYTLAAIRNSEMWRGSQLVRASVVVQGAYMVGDALGPSISGLALDLSPSLGLTVLVASAGLVGLLTLVLTPREQPEAALSAEA